MAGGPKAGWRVDPTGRFDQRYWDGSQWTDHVAEGSALSTNAFDPTRPTAAHSGASGAPPPPKGPLVIDLSKTGVGKGLVAGALVAMLILATVAAGLLFAGSASRGSGTEVRPTIPVPLEVPPADVFTPDDFSTQMVEAYQSALNLTPQQATCLTDKMLGAPPGEASGGNVVDYLTQCGIDISRLGRG